MTFKSLLLTEIYFAICIAFCCLCREVTVSFDPQDKKIRRRAAMAT